MEMQGLLTQYSFGKLNALNKVLDNISEVKYNPFEMAMVIPRMYFQEDLPKEGECGELSLPLLKDLVQSFPDEHFYLAYGNELEYFPDQIHYFPIHSDKPLTNSSIKHMEGIENIIKDIEGITILDPVLESVSYEESSYLIKTVYHPVVRFSQNPDLFLGDKKRNPQLSNRRWQVARRPMGFNKEGGVVYLEANFSEDKNEPELMITVHNPGQEDYGPVPLSQNLEIIKDDQLAEALSRLDSLDKIPTKRNIIPYN